ncbi:MAG: NAD(P)/FAD-dependent oxidoreductase, partial [Desulfobacteraceae bacterium]|nr:NAD(P)/FAD-dependent oxidoreductase [Desulfobacteraceae bacterium]
MVIWLEKPRPLSLSCRQPLLLLLNSVIAATAQYIYNRATITVVNGVKCTRRNYDPDGSNGGANMARNYDLAIIGMGAAGLIAASLAKELGARVALLEKDKIGGD